MEQTLNERKEIHKARLRKEKVKLVLETMKRYEITIEDLQQEYQSNLELVQLHREKAEKRRVAVQNILKGVQAAKEKRERQKAEIEAKKKKQLEEERNGEQEA